MTGWIIEPREPLIVRDGRPFDPQPGVMAATLPFPFPSTTAGAARNLAGSRDGIFVVEPQDLPKLTKIQVRGPLLAELLDDGQERLLVPAPGDVLLLEGKGPLRCKQLVPLRQFVGSFIPPIKDANGVDIAPVGLEEYEAEKPAKKQPAFWYWDRFAQWLLNPAQIDKDLSRDALGIPSLPQQQRVHISLEPGMMVAREGALFETRGLEFTTQPFKAEESRLSQTRSLALWLDVNIDDHQPYNNIQKGLTSLGGERRLVKWKPSHLSLDNFHEIRDRVGEQIAQAGACRLVLLTPAYFQQGYLPNLVGWEYEGVQPELRAVLVQRPQVVSGWDLAKGRAKPTRRLAPAGSVFFLKFPDGSDAQTIKVWVKHFWMKCVSDEAQACLDGFGLAVLGTWDGNPKEMQIKESK